MLRRGLAGFALAVAVLVALPSGLVLALVGLDAPRQDLGGAFGLAGMGVMALGALGAVGGWSSRGVTMGYSATVGAPRIDERARLAMRDVLGSYRFVFECFVAGVVLLGVAVAVDPRVP